MYLICFVLIYSMKNIFENRLDILKSCNNFKAQSQNLYFDVVVPNKGLKNKDEVLI